MNTFTGQEHGPGGARQPVSAFSAPPSTATDQWVETCAAMGGSYAVFTAKHEEGFMNFVTNATALLCGTMHPPHCGTLCTPLIVWHYAHPSLCGTMHTPHCVGASTVSTG